MELQGASDDPEDISQQQAHIQELEAGAFIRNMEWWDGISYDELAHWVPTLGVVPRSTHHALGQLRGALLKGMCEARDTGDETSEKRYGKTLTFLDRLILYQQKEHRGGKKKGKATKLEAVISIRIRAAWAGDWASLWQDMAVRAAAGRKGMLLSRRRCAMLTTASGLLEHIAISSIATCGMKVVLTCCCICSAAVVSSRVDATNVAALPHLESKTDIAHIA